MSNTKDNCYSNKEKRRFFLGDEIDESSFAFLYWEILNLIREDDEKEAKEKDFVRKPIHLHICSLGGCYSQSMGLVSLLQNSKTPIHTYNCGTASSGALKVFLAGHKRYCYQYSEFMYHQLLIDTSGTVQSVTEFQEDTKRRQKEIEQYVTARTKMSLELLKEIREKKQNYRMNAEMALKLGVVDEIITEGEKDE